MGSSIKKSKIPRIGALREELGFGEARSSRCKTFVRNYEDFRTRFVSSQGWEGDSMHDWCSEDHQIALDEMVHSFLERHGASLWPDDKSRSRANRLQYSTDSARIKELMKQLFWRVINQQFHNNKQRNKDKADRSGAKRGRSPSPELGTDADAGGAPSASCNTAGMPGTPRSSTFMNQSEPPFGIQTDAVSPVSRSAQSNNSIEPQIDEDLYRVPDSPEPRIPSSQNQPKFAVLSTGIDNDGRQVAPVANMDPFTEPSGGNDTLSTNMSSTRAGKQPARVEKSRTSTRKRKPRNVSDRATDDAVEEALQSLERNPSSDVVERPIPAETNHDVTSDILPFGNNGYRATVSEVTDDQVSITGFLHHLGSETRLEPLEPSNGTNHSRPSTLMTVTEADPQSSANAKSDTRQTSQIPLVSPSIPGETQHADDESPPDSRTIPQALPPVGQPRVEFTYCVACRYPERQSLFWKPEGSFRNKTLSKLEEELPIRLDWSQFQYLHFRLTAPNTRAEHVVCRGREDQFESLKRRLAAIIRDCIADTPRGKTILVEIDIEPLTDETAWKKSAHNDAMDFEW